MSDFINNIKNGIVGFVKSTEDQIANFITDNRDPNRSRPRQGAEDPNNKVDDPNKLEILNFPHDRPKYFISFAFEEYRRPTQFEGLKSDGLTDYIALPLPANLKDANQLNWGKQQGSFLVEALTKTWQDQGDEYKKGGMSGMIDHLKNNLPSLAVQGGDALVGLQIQNTKDLLQTAAKVAGSEGAFTAGMQLLGLADNPFMTVTFGGPEFKVHDFAWTLSAKSKEESKTIRKIVDTLKKAAYPELLSAAAGGFYKYPMIVWPKFNPDAVRTQLYQFKPCVITQLVADFTPNGTDRPGFYAETSAPIVVSLHMQLLEIELWRNGKGTGLLDNGELNMPTISTGDFNDIPSPPVRNLGKI